MKKIIFTLLALGIIIVYLNRGYAHKFSYMSAHFPGGPAIPNPTIIEPQKPTNRTITYAALGDSLTAGIGTQKIEETFPYLLGQKMAKKNDTKIKIINLGIPGATTADVLEKELPALKNQKIDVATLLIGVNDVHARLGANNFGQNINKIVDALTTLGIKKINILTAPLLGNGAILYPPFRLYYNWQTNRYNTSLKLALKGKPVNVVDLNTLIKQQDLDFLEYDYYSRDGFHPSGYGYSRWADLVYAHLNF